MPHEWYVVMGEGVEKGPCSGGTLKALAKRGEINRKTLIRRGDLERSLPAGSIKGLGLNQKRLAREAHASLAGLEESDVVEVEGEVLVVGELRADIDAEAMLVFVINYGLGLLMIGLFFWAKWSPLPAILTGLAVYLVMITIVAIGDPSTLVSGIVFKILLIGALLKGMQAALAQRKYAEEPETA